MANAEKAVKAYTKVDLTPNQYGALVSFVFNCGGTAYKNSTLLRKLNAGDYDAVPRQLMRWTRNDGKIMRGLVRRRAAEAELFTAGMNGAQEQTKHVSEEPVNGSDKPLMLSRTNHGAGAAGAGGALIVGKELVGDVSGKIEEQQDMLSSGDPLTMLIAGVVVAGALYAAYARWCDAGRPLPWRKSQ